jgi:arylsulfatase A-like enzyme
MGRGGNLVARIPHALRSFLTGVAALLAAAVPAAAQQAAPAKKPNILVIFGDDIGWFKRVPMAIRWPGVIQPGKVYSDMFAHEDLLPTFAGAAGDRDVVARCMKGCTSGGRSFKVHLDGHDLGPYFRGEAKESPRKEFLYWSDDGDLLAIRVQHWKVSFKEQEHTGVDVWKNDFTNLRAPNVYNLRADRSSADPSRSSTANG